MADRIQREKAEQITEQIETSQLYLEKSAFEAINHEDKVLNLTKTGMNRMLGLLSEVEAVGFTMEEAMVNLSSILDGKNPELQNCVECISKIVGDQGEAVRELGSIFQDILDEQFNLSEVIHSMEYEIANHRDILEIAQEFLAERAGQLEE